MFSEEEKKLIESIYEHNLDFNRLSSDDFARIKISLEDEYALHCLDSEYNPNKKGILIETVIDKISSR